MSFGPEECVERLDYWRTELPKVRHCRCSLCGAAQQGENERAREEGREPRNVTEINDTRTPDPVPPTGAAAALADRLRAACPASLVYLYVAGPGGMTRDADTGAVTLVDLSGNSRHVTTP